MSDAKRRFEEMAIIARGEIAPAGDVSGPVLASIRESRRPLAERPMLVFAGVYAVCCAVAVFLAYQYMGMTSDPMTSFFALANEVMP